MAKKGDFSDLERGMVVHAQQAGLSIAETADLLGFLRTAIFGVYEEGSKNGKTSSEQHFCG